MDTHSLIKGMVEDIYADSPSAAMEKFEDILSIKTSDVLDQRRADIASSLYSTPVEEAYDKKAVMKAPGYKNARNKKAIHALLKGRQPEEKPTTPTKKEG
jgi:hypothetical protein